MKDPIRPLMDRNSYAVTADVTLQRAQLGDCLVHNTGAAGAVTITLPPGTAKMKARFLRVAAFTMTIDPDGTEIIKDASGTSLGAGVAKSLTASGAYCELEHDGVAWNVIADRPAAVADSIVATMLAAGAVDEAAVLAAGVVTPPKLVGTGMKAGHFAGRNGAGSCTLTGAAVGDRVLVGWKSGDVSDNNTAGEGAVTVLSAFVALFEAAITVVDQIQQTSATDLSDNKYTVLLIPAAA